MRFVDDGVYLLFGKVGFDPPSPREGSRCVELHDLPFVSGYLPDGAPALPGPVAEVGVRREQLGNLQGVGGRVIVLPRLRQGPRAGDDLGAFDCSLLDRLGQVDSSLRTQLPDGSETSPEQLSHVPGSPEHCEGFGDGGPGVDPDPRRRIEVHVRIDEARENRRVFDVEYLSPPRNLHRSPLAEPGDYPCVCVDGQDGLGVELLPVESPPSVDKLGQCRYGPCTRGDGT